MSLKAGRVGVHPADVDPVNGHLSPSAIDSYTKAQADDKFETIEAAGSLQPKTLAESIVMPSGTKTTVETALQGLNSDKQDKGVWTTPTALDLTGTDLAGLGTLKWAENVKTHEAIISWVGNASSPGSDVQAELTAPYTEEPIVEAASLIQNGRYMNVQSQKFTVRLSSGKNWSLGYLLFATKPRS